MRHSYAFPEVERLKIIADCSVPNKADVHPAWRQRDGQDDHLGLFYGCF